MGRHQWDDEYEAWHTDAPTPWGLMITAVFALCAIMIAVAWVSLAHGRELVPGQYAQVPEEIQQWYKSVRSPERCAVL